MKYFLFDSPVKSSNIADALGSKVFGSIRTKRKLIGWIKGCWEVINVSHRGDTIICWYDFQAVICWLLSKLVGGGRIIYCINLLLKDKNTLKNRCVSLLYKWALQSDNFKATVTSIEYGHWLNKKLHINKEYYLVHDMYKEMYEETVSYKVCPNSVFCGGRNGRDWAFLFKIAEILSELTFNIVMGADDCEKYKSTISSNVNVFVDIPLKDFMRKLCESEVVCLPLDTEAPAGLIVMFQAAANEKPIFITNTVTMREYISDETGILLNNNVEEWCQSIRYYLQHKDDLAKKASVLKKFLSVECSQSKFIERLKDWINKEECK